MHVTLDDWIRRDSIPFSADSSETFNTAVDQVIGSLGDSVELLGFGEALHGGEDILLLRNRLFQRLVETHGYSAMGGCWVVRKAAAARAIRRSTDSTRRMATTRGLALDAFINNGKPTSLL